ncbi:MAG: hypothetical protein U0793_24420 [Gemmataceae bacterium]
MSKLRLRLEIETPPLPCPRQAHVVAGPGRSRGDLEALLARGHARGSRPLLQSKRARISMMSLAKLTGRGGVDRLDWDGKLDSGGGDVDDRRAFADRSDDAAGIDFGDSRVPAGVGDFACRVAAGTSRALAETRICCLS